MEEFFQVLVIIGIIVAAIAKQISKKAEENENKQPATYPEEIDFPPLPTLPKPQTKTVTTESKLKIRQTTILQEETATEPPEFDIHSPEEVRKAIIWSEILNRKY